jgi:phosphate transport system permease protein
MAASPLDAGIRTALLGTLWLMVITLGVAFPLGVGAAIYLEEYATGGRLSQLIETNIRNLAGVPSIIYGLLGLAVFVRALGDITGGRSILAAGLTMALLILPLIIINAQEALRAVPNSLREASYGIGATQWQTIWRVVLPAAMPGVLTGTILATSRAIGETAPLIVVGASTFILTDPNSVLSKFTALPIQIYDWAKRPEVEFRDIAAATIIVLLVLLLALNAAAIYMRQRFRRKLQG